MGTAIKHPVAERVKPSFEFLTSGHSDAYGWASACPDVKNYKWLLNPVWHKMLYSCTRMATVGVKESMRWEVCMVSLCWQRWYWFGHQTRVQSTDPSTDELIYDASGYFEMSQRPGAVVGIKIRELTKVRPCISSQHYQHWVYCRLCASLRQWPRLLTVLVHTAH